MTRKLILGHGVNIALRHKEARLPISSYFRQSTVLRRNYRQTTGLRFLQKQALTFLIAFDTYATEQREMFGWVLKLKIKFVPGFYGAC